jgi:Polyketide cyclase / dehydrase and lipid transport
MGGDIMQTIDVSTHIHAPIEKVWEFWTNHEGYTVLKGVSKAELLEEGRDEKNGVGAVRVERVLLVTFIEDIVTFDAPNRLEYRVKKSTIPIRHEIGTLDFTRCGTATDVHWVTRYEVTIPLVGGLLAPILTFVFGTVFQNLLTQSKAILES